MQEKRQVKRQTQVSERFIMEFKKMSNLPRTRLIFLLIVHETLPTTVLGCYIMPRFEIFSVEEKFSISVN